MRDLGLLRRELVDALERALAGSLAGGLQLDPSAGGERLQNLGVPDADIEPDRLPGPLGLEPGDVPLEDRLVVAREPFAELEYGVAQLQVEDLKVLRPRPEPPNRELYEPARVLGSHEPDARAGGIELVRETDGGKEVGERDPFLGRRPQASGAGQPARELPAHEFFSRPSKTRLEPATEAGAYLAALGGLLPRRSLAVDVGTGDGRLLEVLAPVYDAVIGVDRAGANALDDFLSQIATFFKADCLQLAGFLNQIALRDFFAVARTAVFDAHGAAGVRFTMEQPWSMLLMNDARVIHETTPIQSRDAAGVRDTLVLTYRAGGFQAPEVEGGEGTGGAGEGGAGD